MTRTRWAIKSALNLFSFSLVPAVVAVGRGLKMRRACLSTPGVVDAQCG